jgi:hypothetical protein
VLLAPPVGFGYRITNDNTMSSTFGTTLTASGSTHTMGTWVSLLSTIDEDIYWVWITLTNANTAGTPEQVLVDLGIGPDSSNVTVIAHALSGSCAGAPTAGGRNFIAPLFIPAGTQLWGRCQSSIASNTIVAAVQAWGAPDRPGSFPVVHAWEPEGENLGTSLGTTVTPGASGAQGAYAQMAASAAFDYVGCMFAACCADTTQSVSAYGGAIGIGAATEEDLGLCYWERHTGNEDHASLSIPVFADIPAGTRIAARMSCHTTSDATMSGIAYGLRS